MVIIYLDDGFTLMDRPALVQWTREHVSRIRRHCPVRGSDSTGRAYYHAEQCVRILRERRETTMVEATTPEQFAGRRIAAHRQRRGLSQKTLAERMTDRGFSWLQTTAAKTEAAQRPLRVNELVAIAEILDVDTADMLDRSSRHPDTAIMPELST